MRRSPRRSIFLPVWALVLASAVGTLPACSAGCRENGKRMFETAPQKPRPIMIALRSLRGSRESTIDAAKALLYGNPRLGKPASEGTVVELAATSSEPAHLIGSVTLVDSPSSVAEILRVMNAVAERFKPVPDADPAHPVLELELWWVAGVHKKVGELELPDPRILDERWANEFFALSASGTAVNAAEHGLEERRWVGRVARKWDRHRDEHDVTTTVFEAPRSRTVDNKDGVVSFRSEGEDEADLLAQAAESSFEADIFHQRYRMDATFRRDSNPGETATWAREGRALTWFEPITLALPVGLSTTERCRRWLRAVRHKAFEASLEVAYVVLFDVTATQLRGMLIGEHVAAEKRTPQLDLDALLTAERIGPNGYGAYWGLSATFRIPLPTVEAETPATEAGTGTP